MVIRGYKKEKFNIKSVKYYNVNDYTKGSLYSLFTATEEIKKDLY